MLGWSHFFFPFAWVSKNPVIQCCTRKLIYISDRCYRWLIPSVIILITSFFALVSNPSVIRRRKRNLRFVFLSRSHLLFFASVSDIPVVQCCRRIWDVSFSHVTIFGWFRPGFHFFALVNNISVVHIRKLNIRFSQIRYFVWITYVFCK